MVYNQKLNLQIFREMEKAKDFKKKRNLCEIGLKYTQVSSAHGFSFVGNTELPWYFLCLNFYLFNAKFLK